MKIFNDEKKMQMYDFFLEKIKKYES